MSNTSEFNTSKFKLRGDCLLADNLIVKVYNYEISKTERQELKDKHFIACCSVKDKILILYPEFSELSKEAKTCILLHETAHMLGIDNEDDADKYAISKVGENVFAKTIKESQTLMAKITNTNVKEKLSLFRKRYLS